MDRIDGIFQDIENCVICEIKANSALSKENEAQPVNYLVATGVDTGLLINFGGTSLEYKRIFNKRQNQDFQD